MTWNNLSAHVNHQVQSQVWVYLWIEDVPALCEDLPLRSLMVWAMKLSLYDSHKSLSKQLSTPRLPRTLLYVVCRLSGSQECCQASQTIKA